MIDGRNFFDQPIKNNLITYDNIQKIATALGDDYMTGCLWDYNYFNNYIKMRAIDLSKQQALDTDPKAIQQINFTGNLDRAGNKTIFSLLKKQRKQYLIFHKELLKVL